MNNKKNKGEADISVTILTIGLILSIAYIILKPISPASFTAYTTQKFEQTENVEILNTAPQRSYTEIGEIHAPRTITEKATLEKAIKKAKEVGADAIIIKERTKDAIIAIAIKYQQ